MCVTLGMPKSAPTLHDWRDDKDKNTPDPPTWEECRSAHIFDHPLAWEEYTAELAEAGPKHLLLALLRREVGKRERAIAILQRKHINLEAGKIFVAHFKTTKNKTRGGGVKKTKMKCDVKKTKVKRRIKMINVKREKRKQKVAGDWEDISAEMLRILRKASPDHGGTGFTREVTVRCGRGKRTESRQFILPSEKYRNEFLFKGQTSGCSEQKGVQKRAISGRAVRKMIEMVRKKAAKKYGNPDFYFITSRSERHSVGHWHDKWDVNKNISRAAIGHKSESSWNYYITKARITTGAVKELRSKIWEGSGTKTMLRALCGKKKGVAALRKQ